MIKISCISGSIPAQHNRTFHFSKCASIVVRQGRSSQTQLFLEKLDERALSLPLTTCQSAVFEIINMKRAFQPFILHLQKWFRDTIVQTKKVAKMKHLDTERTLPHMLVAFNGPHMMENWRVASDADIGGGSTVSFTASEDGKTAVFEGNLCLKPPKGVLQSGYACVMSQEFHPTVDLEGFDALEMRVKTDGRLYIANLKALSSKADDLYQLPFSTANAGKWENVVLPFSDYSLTWRGWLEGEQWPVDKKNIEGVGILMAERKDGPFRMEIEWIRAINLRHRLSKSMRYTFE